MRNSAERRLRRRVVAGLTATAAVIASALPGAATADPEPLITRMNSIVPAPVSVQPDPAGDFEITRRTKILAPSGGTDVGRYLAGVLGPSTGFPLPVSRSGTGGGNIALVLGASTRVGESGYELSVRRQGVTLRANTAAGLFAGVQTLRQLLPPAVESRVRVPGPWIVPGGQITDYPRFGHRGAMLDVSRHFFGVEEVKRYIDQIALYKINVLHLHLADDQGWRIEIKSWPRLATVGGSTEVGGGPGGYYTQQQYRDLVAYAASRHITIVPEIDMPGHTNAALASYAELNCDGVAPPLYTGTDVGFSSLCIRSEITYRFLDDVLRELAALTPGPYLHIGTDEAHATTEPDYLHFINRVLPIVARHGKKVTGWHEFVKAGPPTSALPQYWGTTNSHPEVAAAVARGNKVLLSPANKAYLDMKYNRDTPLGLSWAGFIEVDTAYGWDPGNYLQGVPETAVAGVEAPLWSETLEISDHIEFMAFPRLPAYAELGWSPWSTHDWASFRERLAAQGPRWTVMGIDFFRSTQIPWPA
ncbi:MAG TPA: beta-N-acetylhexosaminidase [Actinophytocola sp.]|uniref:beta-N-acetylhexosaminidase n=1 Tax=Actinophytocola sp. TaxID=1872138 RepID=UPI002DBFC3E3|nr:beta-N-acetylhexosaminidase [Actinophytocola sp.]HEU5475754.1 beta-N-acetylhexosaminidase [Actinophytocola sp.]